MERKGNKEKKESGIGADLLKLGLGALMGAAAVFISSQLSSEKAEAS